MPRFRAKPVEIKAILFTGYNIEEVREEFWDSPGIVVIHYPDQSYDLILTTADGNKVHCSPGTWVIPDNKPDTFYPCNDDFFKKKYEEVPEYDDENYLGTSTVEVAPLIGRSPEFPD